MRVTNGVQTPYLNKRPASDSRPPPKGPTEVRRRGIIYMVLASLSFTVMVIGVKSARVEMGPFGLTAARSLVSLPLVWWIARGGGFAVLKPTLVAIRCALGFAAVVCFVYAAASLSLTNLSLLHKLQPLFVALLAPVLLGQGERPTVGTWAALLSGLAGSLLILAPEHGAPAVMLTSGVVAVCGALFSALAHICLRALGSTERPSAVVFWFQSSLLPLSLACLLLSDEAWPSRFSTQLPFSLALVGIFAVGGQLLLTSAYRLGTAARTAAVSYTGPLWAYLADLLLFDQHATTRSLFGGSLVIFAGVWLLFSPHKSNGSLQP